MTDISNLSIDDLKKIQKEAAILIEQKSEQAILDGYNQVNEIAANLGYRIEDLLRVGQEMTKKKLRKPVEARYQSKSDPSQTWSGRGKRPKWLVTEIEKGANLDNFLIK